MIANGIVRSVIYLIAFFPASPFVFVEDLKFKRHFIFNRLDLSSQHFPISPDDLKPLQ